MHARVLWRRLQLVLIFSHNFSFCKNETAVSFDQQETSATFHENLKLFLRSKMFHSFRDFGLIRVNLDLSEYHKIESKINKMQTNRRVMISQKMWRNLNNLFYAKRLSVCTSLRTNRHPTLFSVKMKVCDHKISFIQSFDIRLKFKVLVHHRFETVRIQLLLSQSFWGWISSVVFRRVECCRCTAKAEQCVSDNSSSHSPHTCNWLVSSDRKSWHQGRNSTLFRHSCRALWKFRNTALFSSQATKNWTTNRYGTGLVAQLAERRAWYPKVLGSIQTFSTKHVTCLSPAVGGLK